MDKLRFLLLPLLALTFVPFSMAQDSDEDVEEVVVTGSRITNPNIVSTSQVQVVTAEDIDNRGAVRIEEVLNDLPQLSPGQIAQVLEQLPEACIMRTVEEFRNRSLAEQSAVAAKKEYFILRADAKIDDKMAAVDQFLQWGERTFGEG